jgi:hypothetical protein
MWLRVTVQSRRRMNQAIAPNLQSAYEALQKRALDSRRLERAQKAFDASEYRWTGPTAVAPDPGGAQQPGCQIPAGRYIRAIGISVGGRNLAQHLLCRERKSCVLKPTAHETWGVYDMIGERSVQQRTASEALAPSLPNSAQGQSTARRLLVPKERQHDCLRRPRARKVPVPNKREAWCIHT